SPHTSQIKRTERKRMCVCVCVTANSIPPPIHHSSSSSCPRLTTNVSLTTHAPLTFSPTHTHTHTHTHTPTHYQACQLAVSQDEPECVVLVHVRVPALVSCTNIKPLRSAPHRAALPWGPSKPHSSACCPTHTHTLTRSPPQNMLLLLLRLLLTH